jgi:hypothetical protein
LCVCVGVAAVWEEVSSHCASHTATHLTLSHVCDTACTLPSWSARSCCHCCQGPAQQHCWRLAALAAAMSMQGRRDALARWWLLPLVHRA